MANTSWRWPTQPAPKYPALHSYASTSDLHEEPDWPLRPSNRSPSVSSNASTSSTDRSVTPTNDSRSTSSNPWFPASSQTSSSPQGSPSSSSTPKYASRSNTPVAAPQPVRPGQVLAGVGLTSLSPTSLQSEASSKIFAFSPASNAGQKPFDIPTSPTPNPFRGNGLPPVMQLNYLYNVLITPEVLTACTQHYPQVLARLRWQSSTAQLAYSWACSNPRLALLFWMCEDVDAWRRANIYQLEDKQMPYHTADYEGITVNPKNVSGIQWRVMVKRLPPNGQHTDFKTFESVPLEKLGEISPTTGTKSLERVRWIGENQDRLFACKRIFWTTNTQRTSILNQIQHCKRYQHSNFASIVSSFGKDTHVGIITSMAQCDLDEYMHSSQPMDASRAKNLLDWVNDLTQALSYLHSRKVAHKSIRPQKILIEGSHIYFSAFGIGTGTDSRSINLDHLTVTSPSYIFAAPETISSGRQDRSSDVFALGCVFLCMMTVLKGWSLHDFATFRSSSPTNNGPPSRSTTHVNSTASLTKTGNGTSFHANIPRVDNWRKQLQTVSRTSAPGASGSSRSRDSKSETPVLEFIGFMLRAEPSARVTMKKLAPYVSAWHEPKAPPPRRSSFGAGSTAASMTMLPLTSTTPVSTSQSSKRAGGGGGAHGSGMSGTNDLLALDGYYTSRAAVMREKGGGSRAARGQ